MILVACIHYPKTGIYYPGLRHRDIVKEIIRDNGDYPTEVRYGFIDEDGFFHDRQSAFMIANLSGQIVDIALPAVSNDTLQSLYSEDIY